MSSYCHNAGRFFYISDHDYNVDLLYLYPYANATYSTFPECKWYIYLSRERNTEITISRNSTNNDEKFYIYHDSGYDPNYLFTKGIVNCGSESNVVKLSDAGYLRFYGEKLNDNSDYRINISQKL